MADDIGFAVIGAGDVADRHIEGLLREPGARIVAVAEPDPGRRARFQARYGVEQATAHAEGALDLPGVQVALVLTPHDLHEPVVLEALRAGKDVLCEKPFAPTVAACDRMLAAAKAAGRRLYVTHTYREEFFFKVSRERLGSGELGRPLGASFEWFTDEEERLETPGHWKGTRARSGGGVLIDGGCHVADVAHGLLGRARRVQAFSEKLVARREEVGEDTAAFTIEHEGGALSTCLLSFTWGRAFRGRAGFAAGMRATISAATGRLEGGFQLRDADFRRWCREVRPGVGDLDHYYDGRGRPGDIDCALLAALRSLAPPPLTALDARNAVAIVEAAYASIEAGRAVEVDWRDE